MPKPPEPFRELDWAPERAEALGRATVELWGELLKSLPKRPVFLGERAEAVRDAVTVPIPAQPLGDEQLIDLFRTVVDHSMFPGHPGFMAYITGAGTVPGAAADLLAAAINQNLGGWRLSPAATEIELSLGRWFAERFGLPAETAGGYMVSGGVMANFIGLKLARDHAARGVRQEGLSGGAPMRAYASTEVHFSTPRSLDMLGIGADGASMVPIDDDFRMDVDELVRLIQEDLGAGRKPFAVVASAGTVATGAIDPLERIADVCERFGLWLHIDAAYGGPAVLAPDLRPLLAGIERADSIAFDPHKWLYTPHSGGCVLARDMHQFAESFALIASYIVENKEQTGTGQDIAMFGPQLSRGFQAFKVWASLLAHGTDAYARRISHDAALARYMGELVEERPTLEPMADVGLSICCFRYVPPDLLDGDPEERERYLDKLNERIMTAIWLDGRVFISNAVLRGRFVLRACIVNFRTEAEHVELVLDVAEEIGARLDAELRPESLRAG